MSALPADIAKYTNNGVGLRAPALATSVALKAAHPDAVNMGESEIEMFFVNADHAQIMLDEKAVLLTKIGPLHDGIEVEESLGIGTTIPISPIVPSFLCVDDERGISVAARTRAYAHDTSTDRFSVEVLE